MRLNVKIPEDLNQKVDYAIGLVKLGIGTVIVATVFVVVAIIVVVSNAN